MKIKGKIYGITKDILSGQRLLTVAYEGEIGEEINDLAGKEISVEIKPYRKKRSLNANKYMWELCSQIGEKVELPANEIYRDAITQMNVFKYFMLTQNEASTFKQVWEDKGTGWITDQVDYDEDGDRVVIRAYYGSSTYNTKQMSRLIDWLVEEAKELGITVISEQERTLLIDNWKGALS